MKATASSKIVDASPVTFAVMVRDARSLAVFWDFPASLDDGASLRLRVSGGTLDETVLDLPSGRLVMAFAQEGQTYELTFGLHRTDGFEALSTQSITLPPARPVREREALRGDLTSRRTSVFLPQELVALAH